MTVVVALVTVVVVVVGVAVAVVVAGRRSSTSPHTGMPSSSCVANTRHLSTHSVGGRDVEWGGTGMEGVVGEVDMERVVAFPVYAFPLTPAFPVYVPSPLINGRMVFCRRVVMRVLSEWGRREE